MLRAFRKACDFLPLPFQYVHTTIFAQVEVSVEQAVQVVLPVKIECRVYGILLCDDSSGSLGKNQ